MHPSKCHLRPRICDGINAIPQMGAFHEPGSAACARAESVECRIGEEFRDSSTINLKYICVRAAVNQHRTGVTEQVGGDSMFTSPGACVNG